MLTMRGEDLPPVPIVAQKTLTSGSCFHICAPVHCSWAFQFYMRSLSAAISMAGEFTNLITVILSGIANPLVRGSQPPQTGHDAFVIRRLLLS